MIDPAFHHVRLPAELEEAGYVYGRLCAHLLHRDRLAFYLDAMMRINRTDQLHLSAAAEHWAGRLPERYTVQMHAMAAGAGVPLSDVHCFLYADIAAPRPSNHAPPNEDPAGCEITRAGGESGCSGLIVRHDGRAWVGRNCDWYRSTLGRGTAAVFHAAPHRIPCVAVGLMGDLDADTGMNAERLWLHMHTLLARDEPRAGVSCISWLFWMREALETCASLSDVERLLESTDRDRGVMLFAVDGKTGESAVYECTRSSFHRLGADHRGRLIATNHCRHKHPPASTDRVARPGSTVTRYNRLNHLLDTAHPEHLPDDLCEVLGDELVEMRETAMSSELRTIYSAVADPARNEIWFASGACPAASRGTWRRVRAEW